MHSYSFILNLDANIKTLNGSLAVNALRDTSENVLVH